MSSNDNTNPDMGELMKRACINAMRGELSAEIDPQTGLRKALLTLILLTADDVDSLVTDFISYLLVPFPPLAQHFVDHKYALFDGEAVMRARTAAGDKVVLLTQESFWTRAIQTLDDS